MHKNLKKTEWQLELEKSESMSPADRKAKLMPKKELSEEEQKAADEEAAHYEGIQEDSPPGPFGLRWTQIILLLLICGPALGVAVLEGPAVLHTVRSAMISNDALYDVKLQLRGVAHAVKYTAGLEKYDNMHKQRLIDFYTKHSPEELESVDRMLERNQGKERALFKKLKDVYRKRKRKAEKRALKEAEAEGRAAQATAQEQEDADAAGAGEGEL